MVLRKFFSHDFLRILLPCSPDGRGLHVPGYVLSFEVYHYRVSCVTLMVFQEELDLIRDSLESPESLVLLSIFSV